MQSAIKENAKRGRIKKKSVVGKDKTIEYYQLNACVLGI